MASLERAREAKVALRRALAGHDGVTGIGLRRATAEVAAEAVGGAGGSDGQTEAVGDAQAAEEPDDTWCLQVNVVDASVQPEVPGEIDGVTVVVRITGQIDAD